MDTKAPSVSMATPAKSPATSFPKGLSLLSGIGIFSNPRIPDPKKPNGKLFDVHFFVPGFGDKQQALAALYWYDDGSIDWSDYLPNGAFFLTAHVRSSITHPSIRLHRLIYPQVCKYSRNLNGLPIASAEYPEDPERISRHPRVPIYCAEDYHFVGDIISVSVRLATSPDRKLIQRNHNI
jgi:hypothetical protein